MTDKESYAERLGEYLGDWSQDADDKAFVEEAAELEAEVRRLETALDAIIKAPGGGPGKRIARQARG